MDDNISNEAIQDAFKEVFQYVREEANIPLAMEDFGIRGADGAERRRREVWNCRAGGGISVGLGAAVGFRNRRSRAAERPRVYDRSASAGRE